MRDSLHRGGLLYAYIEVFVLRERVELEARERRNQLAYL